MAKGKKTLAVATTGTVTVEWGSRSKALQARLTSPRKITGDSFLLVQPGGNPVKLGWIAPADKATWQTATPVNQPTTRNANDLQVSAKLSPPAASTLLRLDFELTVTAGASTSIVLSLRQLYTADATGITQEEACAITVMPLVTSADGPRQGTRSMRVFSGRHPLTTMTSAKVSINCEFVDVTELWWMVRKDQFGWYLNPLLGSRQTNLRVLGWTAGGPPMLWFAVVPDTAASSLSSGASPAPADLVFYRPVPGVNAFVYSPTEKGFLDTNHDVISCRMLARYLLSPIPASAFSAIKASGKVKDVELLADQIQPSGTSSKGTPLPADPMDFASGFPGSFRPVGLEGAFNRAGGSRVLFLPLGAGDVGDTYEGAVQANLRTTVRSAMTVLWNVGAVDGTGKAIPTFEERELWVAGHSAGNLSMWSSAGKNSADIARIITFDATPFDKNLSGGLNTIRIVNAARGGKLQVVAIVTPNLGQNKKSPPGDPWQGLDDDTMKKLLATGATVTFLPSVPQRATFWKPAPLVITPGSVPATFVRYLLANWPDLTASAGTPARWRFLFFHEMAVFGGDLVAAVPPATSPTVKTFFEQALA